MPRILRVLRVLPTEHAGATGSDVPLPPGKPYAALCLIALEKRGVSRTDLGALLWPSATPERAKQSVRQALHVIRGVIGAAALIEEQRQLAIADGHLSCDLEALDAALAAGRLDEAHAMWGGGPFAGFSLADAPAFNDWADQVRNRYEARLGSALASAGQEAAESGDRDVALRLQQMALDVRPDETTHLVLVRSLIASGRLEAAEAALARAEALVDEPSEGAFASLRADLAAARRATVVTDEEPTRLTLEFVGRTQETAALRRLWRSTLTGRSRVAGILGGAGVGKTRLAESLILTMVSVGSTVVRVKSPDADRGIDFAQISDIVRELAALPGAAGISGASHATLRRLVPSLGSATAVSDGGEVLDTAVADATLDLIEAVVHEGPLVLLLDDFQWADRRSRRLILRVLRALRDLPVFVTITCRSSDADLSAVRGLRGEGAKGRFEILELGALTHAEVAETVYGSLRVTPAGDYERVTSRLYAASQGNPLFLAELLQLLIDQGVVVCSGGEWTLDAEQLNGGLPLPRSVREILANRLSALSEDATRVAALIARHASGVPADRIASGASLDDVHMTSAVAELFHQGMVAWTDADRLDFAHDSLREVARSRGWAREARRRRRVGPWAAAALLALVTVAAGALYARISSAPPFLGGGTVYLVSTPGTLRVFSLPSSPRGEWVEREPMSYPPELGALDAEPGPGGAVRYFGTLNAPNGVPYPAELVPGEEPRSLSRHEADNNFASLHPGQRLALTNVSEEEPHYRMNITVLDLLTGRERRVRATPAFGGGVWTPDGRSIVATMRALEADTVLLLRADGRELEAHPIPGPNDDLDGQPCARDGSTVLLYVNAAGSGATLELMNMDTGERTAIDTRWAPTSAPPCSPDGEAVVYLGAVEGAPHLVAKDLRSGVELLGPQVSGVLGYSWVPASVAPFPTALMTSTDSISLEWGEQDTLTAGFIGAPSAAVGPGDVEWSSEDVRVAYVGRDGRVVGQGEGRTRIVASALGLLYDTIEVHVGSATPPDALLVDRFERFDTTRWATFGSLAPAVLTVDGRSALDASGAAVNAHGLLSRQGFDLSRGGTLEVTYRLPLTRTDRQSIQLCLMTTDRAGPPVGPDGRLRAQGRVCFMSPIGQLSLFDSTAYSLHGQARSSGYRDGAVLPSDAWHHLTLILAPDGAARLLIDREERGSAPSITVNGPDLHWHIVLFSRAVDTQLLLRDLVLWEGIRY